MRSLRAGRSMALGLPNPRICTGSAPTEVKIKNFTQYKTTVTYFLVELFMFKNILFYTSIVFIFLFSTVLIAENSGVNTGANSKRAQYNKFTSSDYTVAKKSPRKKSQKSSHKQSKKNNKNNKTKLKITEKKFTTVFEKIIAESKLNKGTFGVYIIDAKTSKVLFERNSNKYFNPASNVKLITTLASFFSLGPEYCFRTHFYIHKYKNQNNIIIRGFGDPVLTSKDLEKAAQFLHIHGIKTINNIYYDDTYFDRLTTSMNWTGWDISLPYGSPVSALSVNNNAIEFWIKPSKTKKKPKVIYFPQTKLVTIKNQLTTDNNTSFNIIGDRTKKGMQYTLTGTISKHAHLIQRFRPVKNPAFFTASLFKEKLTESGVKVRGGIQRKVFTMNKRAYPYYVHKSIPLYEILYNLNKNSINNIAEHLIKTLGVSQIEPPGSIKKGILSIQKVIQQNCKVPGKFQLDDGSGLSRYNLLTPKQVVFVIKCFYNNFEYGPEILSLLPVYGTDGTTKYRGKNHKRMLRVKTGSLKGSSVLTGVAKTKSGQTLLFSIMSKDYIASIKDAKEFEDKFVSALLDL